MNEGSLGQKVSDLFQRGRLRGLHHKVREAGHSFHGHPSLPQWLRTGLAVGQTFPSYATPPSKHYLQCLGPFVRSCSKAISFFLQTYGEPCHGVVIYASVAFDAHAIHGWKTDDLFKAKEVRVSYGR